MNATSPRPAPRSPAPAARATPLSVPAKPDVGPWALRKAAAI
ncbi:hypothetical protein SAURM35S_07360 [Streptomyces aurantiogriseus]